MTFSTRGLTATASIFALAAAAFPATAYAQTEEQQQEQQQADPPADSAAATTDTTASDATGDQAIVITGSRISRPNFETLEPAVVLGSKEIEARGFETLGQAINEQPAFGVPGASPVGGQAGSFGSGQSFVNFLGLGSQRTLTLVNGRRFVSSNTASIFGPTAAGTQVDLNSINTKLVDRVETIAIGGAPIYGSDAIAGTVNIILKRDYEGFDLDAQYGISTYGDAPNYRVRALAGKNFAGGRGNITLAGEYNRGRGIVYNDRAITARGRFYGDCPANSTFTACLYENRRIPALSESGVLTVGGDVFGINFPLSPEQSEFLVFGDPTLNFSVTDAQGNQLQFAPNGQLIPIDFGQAIGDIAGNGDFNIDFSGGNGFNLLNTQQLLTDSKRYNANLNLQYELTDNIRAFAEGWYAYSKGTNLREQPVYNSGLFDAGGTPDGPIVLSVDNPFLTPEQRAIIINSINNNPTSDQNAPCTFFNQCGPPVPQDYFYLGRANTDLISGRASTATRLYRIVAGLDGSFQLGGRDYKWEIVGNYGRSHTEGREPVLVQQNFENAVNAVRDAGGNIVCAPGAVNSPIPTLSSTCAPLNLFGSGLASQAARDYVTTIADPSGTNKQYVLTASLSGPIMRLPGGDLSFALGYEHRKESTSFDPGAFFFGAADPDPTTDADLDGDPTNDRVQYGRSVAIFPVKGSYNTDELFGELRAALVKPANRIPVVYSLELHGAARYVNHSTAGNDWTWTAEGRWGIIKDIAIRGNYTRAIRAPAITEIFNPSSTFFGFAVDPCDADSLAAGPDPATRQANCAAAGISPNFQSFSNQASFHQGLSGNVGLKNEKSNAWSVGTVLNPRFIPGLTLTADYLDIKLQNAISSFSATQVLNSCYDSPDFPNNQFCPLIQRDPTTDQLDFVGTRYFNAAELRYKGVLAALTYSARTPFLGARSRVGANLSYQYLRSLTSKADAASAPGHLSGSIGYPKHSAVLNLSYENGPYSLFTSFNYTGKVKQDSDEPDGFREFQNVDDVVFVNTGVAFNINDRMGFRLVVDNIFNTKPPFPVPAFGGSVSYFPGILGRYFRAGASIHF